MLIDRLGRRSTSMKSVTLPSGKSVNVPSTGDDWQLYTSSMKCGRAAAALTAALIRVAKEIDRHVTEGYKPTVEGAYRLYDTMIVPTMDKYASFGACDSEPRNVAYDAIERITRMLVGEHVSLFR